MIVVQHRTADDTKVVRIEWEEGDMEVDTDEDDVAEDEDNTGDADVHGTAAADADDAYAEEVEAEETANELSIYSKNIIFLTLIQTIKMVLKNTKKD